MQAGLTDILTTSLAGQVGSPADQPAEYQPWPAQLGWETS